MPKYPEKEEFEDEHAMAEVVARHPTDMLLRKHGYRVHHRPDKGEPIWFKNGIQFKESEALIRIQREGE